MVRITEEQSEVIEEGRKTRGADPDTGEGGQSVAEVAEEVRETAGDDEGQLSSDQKEAANEQLGGVAPFYTPESEQDSGVNEGGSGTATDGSGGSPGVTDGLQAVGGLGGILGNIAGGDNGGGGGGNGSGSGDGSGAWFQPGSGGAWYQGPDPLGLGGGGGGNGGGGGGNGGGADPADVASSLIPFGGMIPGLGGGGGGGGGNGGGGLGGIGGLLPDMGGGGGGGGGGQTGGQNGGNGDSGDNGGQGDGIVEMLTSPLGLAASAAVAFVVAYVVWGDA